MRILICPVHNKLGLSCAKLSCGIFNSTYNLFTFINPTYFLLFTSKYTSISIIYHPRLNPKLYPIIGISGADPIFIRKERNMVGQPALDNCDKS